MGTCVSVFVCVIGSVLVSICMHLDHGIQWKAKFSFKAILLAGSVLHGPVPHPLNENLPIILFRYELLNNCQTECTHFCTRPHIIYHWIELVGLKYIILVIKIADDSTARHASWISRAALWIPGRAGQGQPANLPCDVMPLSECGWYTHPAVRVRQAVRRKREMEEGKKGRERKQQKARTWGRHERKLSQWK